MLKMVMDWLRASVQSAAFETLSAEYDRLDLVAAAVLEDVVEADPGVVEEIIRQRQALQRRAQAAGVAQALELRRALPLVIGSDLEPYRRGGDRNG